MFRVAYTCAKGCGYECVVSNAVHSAFERSKPTECKRCGASLSEIEP